MPTCISLAPLYRGIKKEKKKKKKAQLLLIKFQPTDEREVGLADGERRWEKLYRSIRRGVVDISGVTARNDQIRHTLSRRHGVECVEDVLTLLPRRK